MTIWVLPSRKLAGSVLVWRLLPAFLSLLPPRDLDHDPAACVQRDASSAAALRAPAADDARSDARAGLQFEPRVSRGHARCATANRQRGARLPAAGGIDPVHAHFDRLHS